MYPIKQSTALTIPFFVHDVSGDAVTGLTDGSFTKRISKNGTAFGAMTVTITEMENGWYSIPLSASHSDTLGLLSITFTNAGAKQVNLQYRVHARILDDLAYPNVSGRGLDVDASGDVTAENMRGTDGVDTATMRGTDDAALATALATAQTDLDTITGADGATLASAQGPVTFTGVTDEAGITLIGAGTGPGLSSTGGGTGHGAALVGGATSGDGLNATANGDGKGADLIGVGANSGLRAEGGATGPGIHAHGGATGATPGVEFHAHSASGDALSLAVDGTGDASPELVVDIWDRVLTGATHNIVNSAGRRLRQIEASFVITSGTAQAGTANTITLAAGESAVNNIFDGDRVIIVAGTGVGEHGIVVSYDGTTKICIMSQNWVITPDATSEYELAPADVDIETWQHEIVSVSPTTNLPEVDTKSVSDDPVTADNIELDYDGTGFNKANSTIGTVESLGATAKTDVNAEVADVLKTDVITLPGQEAPPLTPTFEQALSWLYKVFRNRKDQTATLWQLYADDETTVDAKATVSDDATTAVKQEVVTGP